MENYDILAEINNRIPKGNFVRAEFVASESNYIKLWTAETPYFFLYNVARKKFMRNTTIPSVADTFISVDFYSKSSKSFVAKRSDENYCHIIYEDGAVESKTFSYAGEEFNNYRPVRGTGRNSNKWVFYNSLQRKVKWSIDNGYEFYNNESLDKEFSNNFFSIQSADRLYMKLGAYCALDDDKNWQHYRKQTAKYCRYKFDSIQELRGKYLLCKLWRRDEYLLFNEQLVLREENVERAFIPVASWETQKIITNDKYLFVQQKDGAYYQAFHLKDGTNVITPWQHINIDTTNGFRLTVEVDGGTYVTKTMDEFINESSAFRSCMEEESIRLAQKGFQPISNFLVTRGEVKAIRPTLITAIDRAILNNEKIPDDLPTHIDYFASVSQPRITHNEFWWLRCNRKTCDFKHGDTICWFITSDNAIAITEFQRNGFKLVYYHLLGSSNQFDKYRSIKRCAHIKLVDITSDNLILGLTRALDERLHRDSITDKSRNEFVLLQTNIQQIEDVLSRQGVNEELIKTVLSTVYPNYQEKIDEFHRNNSTVEFTYGKGRYKLSLGEKCKVNLFQKSHKRFLSSAGVIIGLVDDNTFAEAPEDCEYDYSLQGDGQDQHFSQHFEKINKKIRDDEARVLLFKKDENDGLFFFDEVKYFSHEIRPREMFKYGTTYILFHLVSQLRYK